MEMPGRYDRFAQRATALVARPWFFVVAVLAIAAWLPTLVLWDTGPSDLFVDAVTNPASLLLLILLQNAQNRGDRAQDTRQDEMEHALATILRRLAASEGDDGGRDELLAAARRLEDNASMSTRMSNANLGDGSGDAAPRE